MPTTFVVDINAPAPRLAEHGTIPIVTNGAALLRLNRIYNPKRRLPLVAVESLRFDAAPFVVHRCRRSQDCGSGCYVTFVSGVYHGPGSQLEVEGRYELRTR